MTQLLKHPPFILSILVIVLTFASMPFRTHHYGVAQGILYTAAMLMIIAWFITLKDILANKHLNRHTQLFWMAAITLLLPVGCILYLWANREKV